MKKKIVLGLVIILVSILALAVLVLSFLDLNKHKDTILTELKTEFPRDIDFRNIEITIISGLGAKVHGLTISENPAFPPGDFLQLESLQVQLSVLSLLNKQIKIKRITLEKPVIRISRNAKGEFNFSDLVNSREN